MTLVLPNEQEKRTDWSVAGVCSLSGGAGVAGGAWLFTFRNNAQYADSYEVLDDYMFIGLGVGAGGKGKFKIPSSLTKLPASRSFSPITCNQSFSAEDLDGSCGVLAVAGIGFLVGYALTYLSAFNTSGILFDKQVCHGLNLGAGASVTATAGMWVKVC